MRVKGQVIELQVGAYDMSGLTFSAAKIFSGLYLERIMGKAMLGDENESSKELKLDDGCAGCRNIKLQERIERTGRKLSIRSLLRKPAYGARNGCRDEDVSLVWEKIICKPTWRGTMGTLLEPDQDASYIYQVMD